MNEISQRHLQAEVRRALGLLHIDTVDLALFQLGKLFENVLTILMEALSQSGLGDIAPGDLSRFSRMVDWCGRSGLIHDETALHFLRIKRNERAHGEIPSLEEREALLGNASTMVRFYLDYILLISKRLHELDAQA